ncbi:MAG: hypothetical protein Q3971_05110 [Moraxella sp.]|nr:hypothetical protein [Moraxella sp.]
MFLKKLQNVDNLKFLVCITILAILISLWFMTVTRPGWHIPTPDEIHYDEGVVSVVRVYYSNKKNRWVEHIELKTDDGKLIHFGCSYTAYYYTQYSNCLFSEEYQDFVKQVHNKRGVVGWYVQKPFLGHNNPYPQLISLSIDGQYTKDLNYDGIIARMHESRNLFPILVVVIFVIWSMLFLFIVITELRFHKKNSLVQTKKS